MRIAIDVSFWYSPYEAREVGESFADGIVALQIIGENGLGLAKGIEVALILVAPNVIYPLHDHVTQELYFVVSGSLNF